ncbi:CPBP family intramembrane metalloprotease [Tenacibaculum sp. S7007]|uniref:CPBP family intramembrane metalloprotease n=1 Tax=Tenacibaculum pelagium TaxID=2759527 RepID=A0A839ASS9_9FLAO|nr:type II CAAX endopeptidase family protein [Tenacibaculum pelagium]MBA6157349.1 CPBP family intramembrane metalloprotease [Tenacibaculum pelagium]
MKQKNKITFRIFGVITLEALIGLLVFYTFLILITFCNENNLTLYKNILWILFPLFIYYLVVYSNKKINKLEVSDFGFRTKKNIFNIGLGITLGFLVMCSILLSFKFFTEGNFRFILIEKSLIYSIIGVLLTSFAIACWEEFFFRGLLFITLLKNKVNFHISAIISSLIFSFSHYYDITHSVWFIGLFFMGYLLCYLYRYTGSIWSVVGFHFIWDFLVFVIGDQTVDAVLIDIPFIAGYEQQLYIIMTIILGVTLIVFELSIRKTNRLISQLNQTYY